MTLRRQTVIAAGAVLFSLVVMLYFVSQMLVMRSYARLEEENTRHKVQEALSALQNHIKTITTITSDWAALDATYAFINDRNQAYIRSNLVDGTFKALELNTMLFIDSSGSLVYGKAYDLINEEESSVSQGLLNYLTPDNLLLNHAGPDSIKSGILLLPENPMLIVSYPILPSEGQGPIRGSLIAGRYLDDHEVSMLTELSQETITIVRLDSPSLLEEYRTVSQTLSANIPIAVRPLDDRTVAGYTFIKDIYGKPALILSVKTGRDIYTQGQNTVAYFILALVVIGLLTGLALIVFLDRQVLSRVSLLSRGVIKIAESGNLSGRVPAAGEDELANLGTAINVMIETLHNTSELMKQKNQLLDAHNEVLQREIAGRQQAEQIYRSLAQNSSTGIYIFQDGKFRFANPEFQKETGYTEEELLNMTPQELVHPDDREQARANAIRMLKGERQSPYEFRSINKRGLTWAMESVSSIIYDGKRATLGTFMDITEHKKLEEELFLRSQLLNSAGDYIGLLDSNRNFKYVNEAYCKAHGYTAEELIGKNISHLDPAGPDEITEKTMKEKNEAVFESKHTRKDGSQFDVEVHARIIYINNERLSLNVEHDITERKQMEQQLQMSNKYLDIQNEELIRQRQSLIEKTEEVQRATRLKSEFLTNMSHELRTPLNVIIGFSELMIDDVPGTTNAEQKQCLTDILSSSRHLLDLINEVLDLSKVESGRMELRFTDVVVGDIAASVARHMKPILASRQQSMDVEIASGMPPAYADAGKLEQVIRNMVDNASKYTPDGGKVKITAEAEGDWCLVSVIDTGIGIKKEDVERIFEPFSRLKSGLAETRVGSGLGLAVVKQIIEKHGGQILVDSELGKGSRFTIKLRAAKKPNKQV